jgi:hypothetical protein
MSGLTNIEKIILKKDFEAWVNGKRGHWCSESFHRMRAIHILEGKDPDEIGKIEEYYEKQFLKALNDHK